MVLAGALPVGATCLVVVVVSGDVVGGWLEEVLVVVVPVVCFALPGRWVPTVVVGPVAPAGERAVPDVPLVLVPAPVPVLDPEARWSGTLVEA